MRVKELEKTLRTFATFADGNTHSKLQPVSNVKNLQ